ncbi:hypothetical protein BGZ65_006351 [Modicella reniformis]|uniref:Uncharacterized protein n=1 Tax=Modicella reniformis TaxID=1440133 RepID=A0A9P6LT51_9FUNG|nr:hypothetical protein BGZ65_006351 [Modicella reniformis]
MVDDTMDAELYRKILQEDLQASLNEWGMRPGRAKEWYEISKFCQTNPFWLTYSHIQFLFPPYNAISFSCSHRPPPSESHRLLAVCHRNTAMALEVRCLINGKSSSEAFSVDADASTTIGRNS